MRASQQSPDNVQSPGLLSLSAQAFVLRTREAAGRLNPGIVCKLRVQSPCNKDARKKE
jgi:hypothetical protein